VREAGRHDVRAGDAVRALQRDELVLVEDELVRLPA